MATGRRALSALSRWPTKRACPLPERYSRGIPLDACSSSPVCATLAWSCSALGAGCSGACRAASSALRTARLSLLGEQRRAPSERSPDGCQVGTESVFSPIGPTALWADDVGTPATRRRRTCPTASTPFPSSIRSPARTPCPSHSKPRMRTRWGRDRLDDELASGADPASSPELMLRAAQLQSRAIRSRLANAIVEMLGRAHEPNLGRLTVAGRQHHAEIREYAHAQALVARLRDDQPINVQGAAMTVRLVNDRKSPLYRNAARAWSAVLSARLALDRWRASNRTCRARHEPCRPVYRTWQPQGPGLVRLRRVRGCQGGDQAGRPPVRQRQIARLS